MAMTSQKTGDYVNRSVVNEPIFLKWFVYLRWLPYRMMRANSPLRLRAILAVSIKDVSRDGIKAIKDCLVIS